MNASAIQYTDSNSMIHISKSYNLVCEYDGNKPDQIEIPELNLVLKKGNWLIKVEGNFLVCENNTRSALYGDAHPVVNPEVRFKKDLSQAISNSIKSVIRQEQRQGGLLTTESKDNVSDVDSTTIKDCRKRFQVKIDKNSIIAGNKFSEGGYIKPPYITEMENQINALSAMVSALECRLNVLSGGK
ncbi:hypothetical protein F891_01866 [Acinetobacter sp. CIP 101966]|uniref:hypothetical protein n=1 Tax=Acinetobacter sp. CIP 101966 TaxID=1144662 RepID=UPI0002CE7CF1|nr:hypothetical protein [Acinetobacter sp. CIP 101966]ENX27257.1 hypothetical protein F891_01866 [Acinetobacter sp. CIP 101966]